jgi:hypothetical protein
MTWWTQRSTKEKLILITDWMACLASGLSALHCIRKCMLWFRRSKRCLQIIFLNMLEQRMGSQNREKTVEIEKRSNSHFRLEVLTLYSRGDINGPSENKCPRKTNATRFNRKARKFTLLFRKTAIPNNFHYIKHSLIESGYRIDNKSRITSTESKVKANKPQTRTY